MNNKAIADLMAAVVPVIKEHFSGEIEKALRPVGERLIAIEAVRPEPGPPGPAGPPGEKGDPGADGERGASLMDGDIDQDGQLKLRMSDGRILNAGIVRGAPGAAGINGEVGPAGRDALEIDIAPFLNETKSYPAGMCVAHRGGVIRATRQTDPVADGDILAAGWAVILEGIAEETETQLEDGRTLERTTVYTSGKTWHRRISLPVPVYRGIWREGEYAKDDVVTYAGSMFIAQAPTTAKPEASEQWRLSVKRGRDGRDAKNGKAN